ncbi:hypothetical protein WR25_01479 [Diploscapter pachys]|uniref:Uncharacterized protein n=1 Tax=Diploscapter pachys TaxID=2018661 RepID=A0A2A2K9G4_9BILA|nr:hypothetical protein WR25_01479 [Diploscapter pachys]
MPAEKLWVCTAWAACSTRADGQPMSVRIAAARSADSVEAWLRRGEFFSTATQSCSTVAASSSSRSPPSLAWMRRTLLHTRCTWARSWEPSVLATGRQGSSSSARGCRGKNGALAIACAPSIRGGVEHCFGAATVYQSSLLRAGRAVSGNTGNHRDDDSCRY